MFDDFKMSHNKGVDWLFELFKSVTKEKAVSLFFLASFSTRRLDWRSGLAAFAVARLYPDHKYKPTAGRKYICSVCGDYSYKESQERNINLLNKYRFATGGLWQIELGPITLAFYLDQFARLKEVKPTKNDEAIFWSIIELIENSAENEKPGEIEKENIQSKTTKRRQV